MMLRLLSAFRRSPLGMFGVLVAIGCSGDGPGVASYSDFRDNQQLPLGDPDPGQGGDAVQQPLRGGAARADQSAPNETQHATNAGQRPTREAEQALRSGGTTAISEEAERIAEDLVDQATSFEGSPIGQEISTEQVQAIATQCAARCSAAGQCLQSCVGACAVLTTLGCVDALSQVTACDCSAGAAQCEELYESVTLSCLGE